MIINTDLPATMKATQLFVLFHSEMTFKSFFLWGSRQAAKRCVLLHLNELTTNASPAELAYIHEVQMAIKAADLSTL